MSYGDVIGIQHELTVTYGSNVIPLKLEDLSGREFEPRPVRYYVFRADQAEGKNPHGRD